MYSCSTPYMFDIILLQDYLPATAETVFIVSMAGLCCFGSSYVTSAFPFTADQFIGASGEQFSVAVYWIM